MNNFKFTYYSFPCVSPVVGFQEHKSFCAFFWDRLAALLYTQCRIWLSAVVLVHCIGLVLTARSVTHCCSILTALSLTPRCGILVIKALTVHCTALSLTPLWVIFLIKVNSYEKWIGEENGRKRFIEIITTVKIIFSCI